MKTIQAKDFIDKVNSAANEFKSVSIPPFVPGQTAKSYLLEDLRYFLCAAINTRLKKYDKSSKPIRDEILLQELTLYYHIIGYTDEDAKKRIISVLDRKEVWDGE